MKTFETLTLMLVLLTAGNVCSAQINNTNVFTPISKYLGKGDAESLSAWFADNLQVSVISQESPASKTQARQIFKSFFASYPPKEFTITHTAGRSNMKYALGTMIAGGERFDVTIFVARKDSTYLIQQLSIERGQFRPSARMNGR